VNMTQNLILIDLSYLGTDRMSTRRKKMLAAAALSWLIEVPTGGASFKTSRQTPCGRVVGRSLDRII
jgi:hypothetical protein